MKKYFLLYLLVFGIVACKKEEKINVAALKMQDFVKNLSAYSKAQNPDFKIVPQNGIQLAFENRELGNALNMEYLNAVDAFGVEEIFYNGKFKLDEERLGMLQQLRPYKTILVSDFIKDNSKYSDVVERNTDNGFLCFPRLDNNYYYKEIPTEIINENSNDIVSLSDAKNFLYLLNAENYTSKNEYLNAIAATNFDIVLIDFFFNDEMLSPSDVAMLKHKKNGAKRLVLSYMNIGSAEKFRYYWKSKWNSNKPSWIKKRYPGYSDEFYVEFWNEEWQSIIYKSDNSYLQRIIQAGFNGAYLDNVEAFYFLYKNS